MKFILTYFSNVKNSLAALSASLLTSWRSKKLSVIWASLILFSILSSWALSPVTFPNVNRSTFVSSLSIEEQKSSSVIVLDESGIPFALVGGGVLNETWRSASSALQKKRIVVRCNKWVQLEQIPTIFQTFTGCSELDHFGYDHTFHISYLDKLWELRDRMIPSSST